MVGGLPQQHGVGAAGPSASVRRAPAPDFTLADATGTIVRLSAYKGKAVLVDFWATWCTGCKVEIPWYIEFQTRYASQGLTSIGVAMDAEGWEKVRPYLDAQSINYSIVVDADHLAQRYGVKELPVTLLIDRDGRIAESHVGMVEKDAWERRIRQLLDERVPHSARR